MLSSTRTTCERTTSATSTRAGSPILSPTATGTEGRRLPDVEGSLRARLVHRRSREHVLRGKLRRSGRLPCGPDPGLPRRDLLARKGAGSQDALAGPVHFLRWRRPPGGKEGDRRPRAAG